VRPDRVGGQAGRRRRGAMTAGGLVDAKRRHGRYRDRTAASFHAAAVCPRKNLPLRVGLQALCQSGVRECSRHDASREVKARGGRGQR